MSTIGAPQAKLHWVALGLVIAGLIVGYSIPILRSPNVFAASGVCKAECQGDNCPRAEACSAEACATGVCDCQK